MYSQLVNFPNHYLPPLPSGGSPSPLLQNSLLQTTFLLRHILMPTLYSSLTSESFKNRTENDRFQVYLARNNEVINAINQNLTDMIKRNYRKNGNVYEETNEEICRRRRSVGYSISSVQKTSVDLQEKVALKFMKRRLGSDVANLVTSMLSQIEVQKKNLEKMMMSQARADEEQLRIRRTTARCKDPFFPVGRECFYLGHKEKLGWHEAKAACHKLQAHLAEPERPRALAKALRKKKGHFNRSWIGGSDEEEEGNWRWLSGGTLIGSRDWRPGQPSNHSLKGDVQDCLVLLRHTPGPPLDDFSCWVDRAYVCETEPEC